MLTMLTVEEIKALLKLDVLALHMQYIVTTTTYGAYIFTPKRYFYDTAHALIKPPDYCFSTGYGSTPQEAANNAWRKYADNRRD